MHLLVSWWTRVSPGYENCVAVSCLVLGDRTWHIHRYDDPDCGCMEGGYCGCEVSKLCRMMALIESPDREGCYQRIGLVKAGRNYAPYWWEECDRVTVTVV